MKVHAYMAWFTVGGALTFLGLLLLLGAPAPGVLVLALGLLHLLVGVILRSRVRRSEADDPSRTG